MDSWQVSSATLMTEHNACNINNYANVCGTAHLRNFHPVNNIMSGKRCSHAGAALQSLARHCSNSLPKSHIDSIAIRANWNSSCTAIPSQYFNPVPLPYWSSATELLLDKYLAKIIYVHTGRTLCLISPIKTPPSRERVYISSINFAWNWYQWTKIIG